MQHVVRSSRRQGFRIHAVVFVISVFLMTAINLAVGEPFWFQWPLIGWGAGLAAHWFFALGPGSSP